MRIRRALLSLLPVLSLGAVNSSEATAEGGAGNTAAVPSPADIAPAGAAGPDRLLPAPEAGMGSGGDPAADELPAAGSPMGPRLASLLTAGDSLRRSLSVSRSVWVQVDDAAESVETTWQETAYVVYDLTLVMTGRRGARAFDVGFVEVSTPADSGEPQLRAALPAAGSRWHCTAVPAVSCVDAQGAPVTLPAWFALDWTVWTVESGMPPERAWSRSRDAATHFALPSRSRGRVSFHAHEPVGGQVELDLRVTGELSQPWADSLANGTVVGSGRVVVDPARGFAPTAEYRWEAELRGAASVGTMRRRESLSVAMRDELTPRSQAPVQGSGEASGATAQP